MNSSDLDNFLNLDFPAELFAEKIAIEVSGYALLMKKKGSSNPLYFYEDMKIHLDRASINRLLTGTQKGKISNIALAYICDCLTLGECVSFENEDLKDIIFDLADPEINGGFKTQDDLSRLLEAVRAR